MAERPSSFNQTSSSSLPLHPGEGRGEGGAHSDESPNSGGEAALSGTAPLSNSGLDLVLQSLEGIDPVPGAVDSRPQITVKPSAVAEACRILKDTPGLSFNMLLCLAGVDYEERFEVVYVLLSLEHENTLVVKVELPYDDPRVPTVTPVWRAAGWYEREAHDLFGIVFEGNPDLSPLVLYEGFEGHPGRKSFPFHEYAEY